MASTASDASSLAQYAEALYPLARVLAGAEEAESLIRRVYEHAAEVPPSQRPDDERAWMVRLLVEARDGTPEPTEGDDRPESKSSFTNDPFRREVAAQTAKRGLPVAFAACSIHERFVLAVDVLADPSDEALAAALDIPTDEARSVRDRARSALRASLRDILTGPERMLVDVALPEDALRSHLHDLLTDRFRPPPSSLTVQVTEILESARARREEVDAATDAELDTSSSVPAGGWAAVRRTLSSQGVLILLGLVLLAGGIGGLSYFSSSSPPAQSVIELSARHAEGLSPTLNTNAPAEAAEYVRQTWGRRLSVPSIEGATLAGVGRLDLGDQSEVPALLYTDEESGTQIVAYAFNYAVLDRLGDRAALGKDLRTELAANDAPLPRQRSGQAVVLWRQRDEIFVLVAPNADAETLRSRIQL